jgi:hypothetical protein
LHCRTKTLLVIPLVAALGALVKDAHGFVGTANLHLQKVGLVVIAGGTDRCGPIDIGPRRGSAQNVIHLFALVRVYRLDGPWARGCHGTGIRTGQTIKAVAAGCSRAVILSDLQIRSSEREKGWKKRKKRRPMRHAKNARLVLQGQRDGVMR